MGKLCLIFNLPSLYREPIYKMIECQYDCDWYFGPSTGGIKEFDTSQFKNVSRYKVVGNASKAFWNIGLLSILTNRKYQTFLMVFEDRCINDWIFVWLSSRFYKHKRIYIWTHGWYGKESHTEARLKLWLFNHVTGSFLYGDRAKEALVKQGVPETKLFAIHNSLAYDKQLALRTSIKHSNIYAEHFGNMNPVIVFIGRLTKVKHLDLLVDAVAGLKQKGERFNVVFVGDGVERESLESCVKLQGLESQFWFYGECYDEALNAELIYNADLCVSPGNIGLTAMHVMMFGCPAITHNDFKWQGPEFEAIKPGLTGDFFERNNVQSLMDTISLWFSTKEDKRDEVRDACYAEIDNNWNPYYQMNLINQIIANAETPPNQCNL